MFRDFLTPALDWVPAMKDEELFTPDPASFSCFVSSLLLLARPSDTWGWEWLPETGTQPGLCKDLVQTRVNMSSAMKLAVFNSFVLFFLNCVFSFSEPLGAISSSVRAGTVVLPRAGGLFYLEDTEELVSQTRFPPYRLQSSAKLGPTPRAWRIGWKRPLTSPRPHHAFFAPTSSSLMPHARARRLDGEEGAGGGGLAGILSFPQPPPDNCHQMLPFTPSLACSAAGPADSDAAFLGPVPTLHSPLRAATPQ